MHAYNDGCMIAGMIWLADHGLMNVLHVAAFAGHKDVLKLFLEIDGRGRDLMYAKDRYMILRVLAAITCMCVYDVRMYV